ncbi:unnamed protein product [Closterium sp. Naga37s-1]|nr:unnamed protein product [Closterium sp. Naga37s-1]
MAAHHSANSGAAGKKGYVIAIRRRITLEKLANFSECDVLVLVACAEGVILDCMGQGSSGSDRSSGGSKAFYAPMVTPFEAMMTLEEGREWTGKYRMLLDGMCAAGARGMCRGGAAGWHGAGQQWWWVGVVVAPVVAGRFCWFPPPVTVKGSRVGVPGTVV